MRVDLSIDEDYTQSYCVLVRALPELLEKAKTDKSIMPWEFVHKYPDLLRAENGMMEIANRKNKYVYKIIQFKIGADTRGWCNASTEAMK